MSANRHVNPRHRAYGRARIDIARRVKTQQDWDALWKPPAYPFPFRWAASGWKQCIEYRVADFAAEVGFFTDVLGMPVRALSPEYVMFADPEDCFCFAVAETPPGAYSTPPGAIRIQFNLDNLLAAVKELQKRGISFVQPPQPLNEGEPLYVATFETPNGIIVDLWGIVDSQPARGKPQAYPEEPAGAFFPGDEQEEAGSEAILEEDTGEDFEPGSEVQYEDLPEETGDDYEQDGDEAAGEFADEYAEEESEDDWETPF